MKRYNKSTYQQFNSITRKAAFTLTEGAKGILSQRRYKFAFTLAEVLITLGIIGIVAALTLPSLIQKHQEKDTTVKLKKFYSVMQNAYLLAVNEEGTPDEWGINNIHDINDAEKLVNPILKHLKYISVCRKGRENCFPTLGYYNYIDGTKEPAAETLGEIYVTLNDGMLAGFRVQSPNCSLDRGEEKILKNQCAEVTVDINGPKKPNTHGIDKFGFLITKNGIVPYGIKGQYKVLADKSGEYFENCPVKGWGCAAWVIYNENMDYLHCPEKLGWDKASSCK